MVKRRIPPRIVVAAALLLTVAVYTPTLGAPYVFDDTVTDLSGQSIGVLLSPQQWSAEPGDALAGRPVASASFALTAALANIAEIDHRMMHRAGNLVLHLACGLLLAAFLELVFRSQPHSTAWRERSELLAAICSALWLVHPLQTEAVNYVVQRTEILVSLFYLGTLYAAIRARDATGKRGRRLWMTAAIIVSALGMATKEVMATVPIAVVLFDGAFRARHWSDLRPRVAFYVGLCLPWAIIAHGLITGVRGNTAGLEVHMSAASYLFYQAWAVAHYLRLVVWPAGLSIDYGVTPSGGARSLIGGLFLITALIAVLLAWKRRTRWGAIAFAGTMFFLLLAPSSSVIPIITELGAERRVYLASASVIILIVVAIDHVWRARWPQRRRLVGAFALGVFLILVGVTARRNQAYASTTELWRTAVVNRPENTRAYVHYAKALIAETPPRYGEADSVLRRAIAVDSMDAFAWDTRVWIAHLEQRYQDEYNLLETSLRIRPTHIWSLRSLGNFYVAHGDPASGAPYLEKAASLRPTDSIYVDLGIAHMAASAADKAILAFERAIAIRPQNGDALRYTGHLLTAAGRPLEGLDYLRRAATYEPRSALGHAFLAKAYAAAKSVELAASSAETAARLSEGNPVVLRIAGRAVLDAGRANEADRYLSAAARGAQDNPAVLTDLGHARAARGLINEAAELYRRALELAPNYAEAGVALRKLGRR